MSPQAGYLLVPEIASRLAVTVPQCVKLVGSEDVEEVTQDAIAMAARMLDSVEKSGKQNVRASHIAYYTLQHIKSGRRSVGNSVVSGKGSGRIYTITVEWQGDTGKISTGTATVTLPRAQGKK